MGLSLEELRFGVAEATKQGLVSTNTIPLPPSSEGET